MSWSLDLSFIKGLMFGIEYWEDDEDNFFYIVLDVGFLRFVYTRDMSEEE